MKTLSRRSFIASAAAVPFSVWLSRHAGAQTNLVRYEARSTQGKAMLEKYAIAVRNMKERIAEGDPRSWLFQWYTHSVGFDFNNPNDDEFKARARELQRVYTSTSDPNRALADEMWITCVNHYGPAVQDRFFLPWHRMYVYFFERIVRSQSGYPDFTLPYWNYSASSADSVIPEEFRKPDDPLFGSLYWKTRTGGAAAGGVNAGRPIGPLNLRILRECLYDPRDPDNPRDPAMGFCRGLDNSVHGTVHVRVGDTHNMGDVPWAARDPIFWLHHSNVDRLWASWNAGGRKNPDDAAFYAPKFIFADENGVRVEANVPDFLELGALGYSYDRLEPVPECDAPESILLAPMVNNAAITKMTAASVPKATNLVRGSVEGAIALTAEPVKRTLNALSPKGIEVANLMTKAARGGSSRKVYLILSGLKADAQPGTTYDLYLGVPEGGRLDPSGLNFVGSIQFFNAVHPSDRKDPAHHESSGDGLRKVSFDITDKIRDLRQKNLLEVNPTLTIVPSDTPVANANPIIAEVKIVESDG